MLAMIAVMSRYSSVHVGATVHQKGLPRDEVGGVRNQLEEIPE